MDLPPLISSLMNANAWPPGTGPVELRQTHISFILLTPGYAYKIKKPVDFGFLDFTTLEKRRHFCEEEVRLNRRLAPGIYLRVVKVTEQDGTYRVGGRGRAVEYAVKMRRIPDESILENRLAAGTADAATIGKVARAVAAFHEKAERGGRIAGFGSPEAIGRNAAENFAQTADFIGKTIPRAHYDEIKEYTGSFLRKNAALLERRAANGFVRDCHGDLHTEHISVNKRVDVFDCIEFNERFRFSDVVADAAFLSMDLDYHNRHDLATAFDTAYFEATGDTEGRTLLDFYRCYRAYVRGKVEGFKSVEDEVGPEDRSLAEFRARYHFHLSRLYASRGFRPTLVVVRGLSGTGKSTLAETLSKRTGYVRLSSDVIRKELAGLPPDKPAAERFEEGIYSGAFTERTYAEAVKRASALLGAGRSAVLDATFSKKKFISAAAKAAATHGASFYIIECTTADAVARSRITRRLAAKGAVSDAGLEVYERQKEGYEKWDAPCLSLDTTKTETELMEAIGAQIFG